MENATSMCFAPGGDICEPLWQEHFFEEFDAPLFRLEQGPFGIGQDDGWLLLTTTTPSTQYFPNPGMGFIGYAWEENGPSLAAREGRQTLEEHLGDLLSVPFLDVLYIRCDWRDVQQEAGKLALSPIWKLTLEAAKRHGKRVAFRIQASSPNFQPGQLALPDFLQREIPLLSVKRQRGGERPAQYTEPDCTSPAYLRAATELNTLLAERLDGEECVEFADLMMFGFWGEGHTGGYENPLALPDCQRAFLRLAEVQRRVWRRTPLAVNVQTDISRAGNNSLRDYALRAGMYLRTDSVLINEPAANEQMAHRPPACAGIVEDGYFRFFNHLDERIETDSAGVNSIEHTLLHALDLGASYYSLWTEGANVSEYHRAFPAGFNALQARMGYRVRPAWMYQRKRNGASEVIVSLHNDGVAGVPGRLALHIYNQNGALVAGGCLDKGHPFPGRMRQCALQLPEGLEGERLELRASLMDKKGERSVSFACAQDLTERGGFCFTLQKNDSRHWRKDV